MRPPATVLGICGSLRRVSSNRALIDAAARLAPPGIQVSLYEGLQHIPAFNPDLDTPGLVSEVTRFRAALETSDAVLICSPEYAHGVPGVLKNALDWVVASGELIDKPVALLNASGRATHAWHSLRETLTVMSARLVRDASIVIPLDSKTSDAGTIVADAPMARLLVTVLRKLVDARSVK